MPVPAALIGWFRSGYPSVALNPDWLELCTDYVQASNPGIAGQPLVKSVEAQLLASDLTTSTLPPTTSPSNPEAKVCFPNKTLVQLVSLDIVSHPAHQLLDTLKDKREAARAGVDPAMAKKEEPDVGLPAQGWQQRQGGPGAGEDGPEEDKIGEWPVAGKGTGRLVVSDGHEEWVGIEYRPLGGWCGLDQVKLGCKLMLHNVRQADGILLLDSKNCTLKGGDVQEWDQVKDYTLENLLRARLGQALLPPPADAIQPDTKPSPPPHDPKPDHKPPQPPKREPHTLTIASSGEDEPHGMDLDDSLYDDGFDDDALAALDAAERSARADVKPVRPVADVKPVRPVADVKPAVRSGHFAQAGAGVRTPLLQTGASVAAGGTRGSQGSSQDVKPWVGGSQGARHSTVGTAAGGKRKVEVIDLLDSSDGD